VSPYHDTTSVTCVTFLGSNHNLGLWKGITDAYTLFLPSLLVGKHVIEFNVTVHLAGHTSESIKRDGVYTVFMK
jgi:hypothetical protein